MQIKKTSDVENHHIFSLIVGASGSGKTTLAATLPHEKTLILSAESGLLSIKSASIDVIEIQSFKDLVDAYTFLANGTKYEHIFIDSLTEIAEIIFTEIKPEFTKSQTFGLYEAYSDRLIKFLKKLRDLTQYNIYMTVLDKLVAKDGTDVISFDLIQKSLSKKIVAYFDLVLYLVVIEKEDGTKTRAICTDNSIIDFCKDRSGKLNKYEKPDLGIINSKIFNIAE
jgi:hypothetical protein